MQLQESTEKKAEEDRGKEEVHMKKQTTKKKNKKKVRDNTYSRVRSKRNKLPKSPMMKKREVKVITNHANVILK